MIKSLHAQRCKAGKQRGDGLVHLCLVRAGIP
jgi:hypothetical protein